jgi:hypothetical protein
LLSLSWGELISEDDCVSHRDEHQRFFMFLIFSIHYLFGYPLVIIARCGALK